jgi:hypothetical protein
MLYPVPLLPSIFCPADLSLSYPLSPYLSSLPCGTRPEPSTYLNHVHHHRIPLRSFLRRAQLLAMTLARTVAIGS